MMQRSPEALPRVPRLRGLSGRLALLVAILVLFVSHEATAEQKAETEDPGAALPTLPDVPSSKFEKPTKEALEALDTWLERVGNEDPLIRERALREIVEANSTWVDAIYHRLNQIADTEDRGAMKERLRRIRDEARNAIRMKMRAEGKRGSIETPDYLTMVEAAPALQDSAYRSLLSVLAMSRVLVEVGTVEATRALIQIVIRFGEFLRVDTQLMLEKLGDRALAGLIEATKYPAEKIQRWAERQLDHLGRAIPSEAVQMEDLRALPDVLRAYGRIRDPDAARIVISFCNSERAQIRLAARQGVALMGDVAHWQLRDTYENIIGKRPARDWSWKRTARELFGAFDRQRLAHVHTLFERGLKAKAQGHLESMAKAFDEALARNPMFDRRGEMADGYVAYALSRPQESVDAAILALHRAERIVEDPKRADEIRSLALTLEAERLQHQGIFDRTLVARALELSPNNQRARLLNETRTTQPGKSDERGRYYGALAILAITLIGIGFILVGRRAEKAVPAEHEAERAAVAEPPSGESKLIDS